MISIKNLHKFFNKGKSNEIHVINDVSLELGESGMCAIFGKSGCGKTTLLNVIGGLDGFAYGSVTVDGKNISSRTDDVRNAYIGYIFQNYNLNVLESCFDNVADALRLCGMRDEAEIERRVNAALCAVDMEKFGKRTPDTLSGGQMQRIAIARAIVKNPKIILADEPTGNLDEANTVMIMDLLKAISKDHLVLLVTHEANLVDYYCDTVIELSDGEVVNVRHNESAGGYTARNKNDIYLGELECDTVESDGAVIEFFGDAPSTPLKLRIVNSGGKLYVEVRGDQVQIIDSSSEIKLREGSYEQIGDRHAKNTNVDMSALPSVEGEKFGKLFSFRSSVKSGYREGYRAKRRGGKLLRRVMALFSAVMVFMTAVFGTSIGDIIKAKRGYNHNVFYVYTDEATSEKLCEAVGKADTGIDYIRLHSGYPTGDDYVYFRSPAFESFAYSYNFDALKTNTVFLGMDIASDAPIIAGSREDLTEQDMIITKKVADDLIESSSLGYIEDYDDLIGLISSQFTVGGKYPSIKGVIDSTESAVYVSDIGLARQIMNKLGLSRTVLASEYGIELSDGETVLLLPSRMEGVEYPEPMSEVLLHGKSFTVAKVKEKIYDYFEYLGAKGINAYNEMEYLKKRFEEANPELAGKDDSDYYEAFDRYYNENYCDWYDYLYAHLDEFLADYYFFESGDFYLWMYFEKGVEELKYNYTDYNYYVAEAYKDKFGKYPTLEILNQYSSSVKPHYEKLEEAARLYEKEFYSIDRFSGYIHEPTYAVSDNDYIEISKRIGETHPTAQGYYQYLYSDIKYAIDSDMAIGGDTEILYLGNLCYTVVHSTDPALTSEWLGANLDLDTGNAYYPRIIAPDDIFKNVVSSNIDSIIGGIVTLVLLVVLLSVCMYFIMRSSLMNRIKEIGIYRAIGVSRRNLSFRFFIESVVLTALTVFVGYLLTSAFIFVSLEMSPLVASVFYYPVWLAAAVLVVLFAISLFFGTLPIRGLLRKTPSEILAKYDI